MNEKTSTANCLTCDAVKRGAGTQSGLINGHPHCEISGYSISAPGLGNQAKDTLVDAHESQSLIGEVDTERGLVGVSGEKFIICRRCGAIHTYRVVNWWAIK